MNEILSVTLNIKPEKAHISIVVVWEKERIWESSRIRRDNVSCGVDWREVSDSGDKIGRCSPAETESTKLAPV